MNLKTLKTVSTVLKDNTREKFTITDVADLNYELKV